MGCEVAPGGVSMEYQVTRDRSHSSKGAWLVALRQLGRWMVGGVMDEVLKNGHRF